MSFSKKEFDQILHEETIKLLSEEGVQEGFLDRIKDLYKRYTKPRPNASQGVGRAFAGYKVPEKQPPGPKQTQQPQSTKAPQTGLATKQTATMEPSDISGPEYTSTAAKQPSGVYDLGLQKKLPSSQQQALPAYNEPPEAAAPSSQLPSSQKIQSQLPAPQKIGILSQYQPLMIDTDKIDFETLKTRVVESFQKTQLYIKTNNEQQKLFLRQIESVLRYLASTKRIIQNPSIGPVDEVTDRPTPSLQQIGVTDFDSWYATSLIETTKKHFGNIIDENIIKFVIRFLFDDSRLAISKRLFNKLIHTKDPRVTNDLDSEDASKNIKESKTYKIFYNSWKEYAKTGVIL